MKRRFVCIGDLRRKGILILMITKANRDNLVLVSPRAEDHVSLRQILRQSPWDVHGVLTAAEGLRLLREHAHVPLVICEEILPDGDWRFVLRELDVLPVRPRFIVCARLASDRLWAEALNLGAYDVLLSAPFEAEEVTRVTEGARLSWNYARALNALRRTAPGLKWNRTSPLKALAAGGPANSARRNI